MLRNTYLNSLATNGLKLTENPETGLKAKKKKLYVKWMDKGKNIKSQLEILNEDEDLINKDQVYPVTAHVGIGPEDLKPAIKTERKEKSK